MNEPFDPSDRLNSDDFCNNSMPSGMEERLMRCRPRSPKLDIEAIAKMAGNGHAAKPITVRGQERSGRYTTPQLVSTIAASWVCGAVVGATFISFSVSSQKPISQNRDPISSNKINQADDAAAIPVGAKPTIETTRTANDSWQFDWNREQLQVGMSLPFRGRLVRASTPSKNELSGRSSIGNVNPNELNADESSSFSKSQLDYVPPVTPMTQGELLKELSRDIGFRVH